MSNDKKTTWVPKEKNHKRRGLEDKDPVTLTKIRSTERIKLQCNHYMKLQSVKQLIDVTNNVHMKCPMCRHVNNESYLAIEISKKDK